MDRRVERDQEFLLVGHEPFERILPCFSLPVFLPVAEVAVKGESQEFFIQTVGEIRKTISGFSRYRPGGFLPLGDGLIRRRGDKPLLAYIDRTGQVIVGVLGDLSDRLKLALNDITIDVCTRLQIADILQDGVAAERCVASVAAYVEKNIGIDAANSVKGGFATVRLWDTLVTTATDHKVVEDIVYSRPRPRVDVVGNKVFVKLFGMDRGNFLNFDPDVFESTAEDAFQRCRGELEAEEIIHIPVEDFPLNSTSLFMLLKRSFGDIFYRPPLWYEAYTKILYEVGFMTIGEVKVIIEAFCGNEDLEKWLLRSLGPVNFQTLVILGVGQEYFKRTGSRCGIVPPSFAAAFASGRAAGFPVESYDPVVRRELLANADGDIPISAGA